MRVLQIKIEDFRGIKNADLTFGGHTLLVSGNNVGKSTICDALDLVLGPNPKGRNQPGADVRGSLKLPKWKAAAPQTSDVENIAINERLSVKAEVQLSFGERLMFRSKLTCNQGCQIKWRLIHRANSNLAGLPRF